MIIHYGQGTIIPGEQNGITCESNLPNKQIKES